MSVQTTPLYLTQGCVVMVFKSSFEAEAEYKRCCSLFEGSESGEAEFHGFRMKTKNPNPPDWSNIKQPLAPWLIRQHHCLVFALKALPENHEGHARNGNTLICSEPPILVGNTIRNFGLPAVRIRAATVPATKAQAAPAPEPVAIPFPATAVA